MSTTQKLYLKELYVIAILLAFCSISYELLIANTLSLLSGYRILWQCLTIGIYLASLGFGTYLSEKDGDENLFQRLLKTEITLSLTASVFIVIAISFFALFFIVSYDHYELFDSRYSLFLVPVILSQVVTVFIGIFSGFEVPLLIRMANLKTGSDRTNYILAFNYFGTLIGTIAFSLFLYPVLDGIYTMICISAINICVCLYLILRRTVKLKVRYILGITVFLTISVVVGLKSKDISQLYLKTYYAFSSYQTDNGGTFNDFLEDIDSVKNIRRIKSLYQYIDIVDLRDFRDEGIFLALNEDFQFDTIGEHVYHESFAHIPIIIYNKTPREVLVLGAGDGLLIRELLRHDKIKSITHVELDKKMWDLATKDKWLLKQNKKSLYNKRVKTLIQDAYYFLRNTKKEYDAIYIDFPYPYNYSTARIYSLEFYYLAKQCLKQDGYIILDCPVTQTSEIKGSDDPFYKFNCMLLSTLSQLKFKTLFPYEIDSEGFITMSKKKYKLNFTYRNTSLPFTPETITPKVLKTISRQRFPHIKSSAYINSIFKPVIIPMAKHIK